MRGNLLRGVGIIVAASLATPPPGLAQPSPSATQPAATAFNAEQLDALLAPIALYSDALLAQVLMASTYPLQVVEASRWLDQPGNKDLKGNALAKALEAQNWDPSDAQRDYFGRSKQNGGTGEYAQRLVSMPGQHDGLYWPADAGEPDSPLAALVAQAVEEGYPGQVVAGKPAPYQGYYFRILKAQGPNASSGAMSYMGGSRMTGGFALVAWPASFGASGVMTFVVSQDGIVFQKDLGTKTAAIAAAMTRYDPDLSWARIDVTGD